MLLESVVVRVLQRFILGQQSHDNSVLTALTVCFLARDALIDD